MNSSEESCEQLGDGVIYKDIMPLKWREISRNELEFTYLSMQDANEEVLRFIATLEEFHVEGQDESGSSADLSRIEFKINLLLDLVTRLVVGEAEIPEAVPVTLGSAGIEWLAPQVPQADSLLELSLYLHRQYPRPFVVIGRVCGVNLMGDVDGNYQIRLAFEPMRDLVQSGLEKFIFRQHRRSIAQSRRTSRTQDEDFT